MFTRKFNKVRTAVRCDGDHQVVFLKMRSALNKGLFWKTVLLEADAVSVEAGYARLIIVYPPAKNHITYGNHRYTA